MIEGISAEHLLADKGYDSDAIIAQARKQGMRPGIPPRKNRKEQREWDKHLYKLRHLVENAFLHLKRWRGIATRYAKNSASFLAAVQILVYAGAIMVLVVFVIMLLNLGKEQNMRENFNPRTAITIAMSAALIMQLVLTFTGNPTGKNQLSAASEKIGSPAEIGNILYSTYIFPFEAISLLLLVAVVGSIILAKRTVDK